MKEANMESEMLPEEAMVLAPGFMQFIDVMGAYVLRFPLLMIGYYSLTVPFPLVVFMPIVISRSQKL
jgi:hypothetical protein